MATHHELWPGPETVHWGFFDAALSAVLEVDSGDAITIDTVSGWTEVIGSSPIVPAHAAILDKVPKGPGPHILTGPVHVRGALPGDVLEVRIQAIELTTDWGWNVMRPLRGTLPEDFRQYQNRVIPLDRQRMVAQLPWGPEIPLQPFFGIIATAPRSEYGRISTVQPREFGGNIDCKEFIPGTSLFLPVFVAGAKLSVGDGHAVQGDGEVCLTALETCLKGTFELVVHKNAALKMPRAVTPTHYITIGLNENLDDAAKQALREMIAWLVQMQGWKPSEAYVFCSLACDLHVTQLVDGNKGIHAMVRRSLLSPGGYSA